MSDIPYSGEKMAKVGEVELAYDTFGDPSSRPMLLIMGLGAQMIKWKDEFCQAIASKGRYVIRFDNRDVGLSTKFDDAGVPDVVSLMQGNPVETPYKLKDMAADAVGLLDVLGIKSADVVGVSMGGMIAQTIAIEYPERVRTLTSIMSSTGNPELPQPKPEVAALLVAPPVSNKTDYINNQVAAAKILHGTTFQIDEDFVRDEADRAYERNYNPQGFARQFAAILSSGSRNADLQKVKIPTLVLHGSVDPLVPIAGGKDTANSIPGAKFQAIEGMGHSFPTERVPEILQAILQHTSQ